MLSQMDPEKLVDFSSGVSRQFLEGISVKNCVVYIIQISLY